MELDRLYGIHLVFKLAKTVPDRRAHARVLKKSILLVGTILMKRGKTQEAEKWFKRIGRVDQLVNKLEALEERIRREARAGGVRSETTEEFANAFVEYNNLAAECVITLSDLIGPFSLEDALAAVRKYKEALGG